MHLQDRRRFVAQCGMGLGALALPRRTRAVESTATPIAVFAKHVQSLDFEELGRRLNSIDVQGIEATLRKGGQIEPGDVGHRLGSLCEALAKHDQRVLIAASDVNEVTPDAERYLGHLAKHGVPYFRMAYYRYDFGRPVLPQLELFAKQAAELAELCHSLGITALYQNHAGRNYVGAAVWDLQRVLADISPSDMAVALDVRHTALELSQSYQAGYLAIRDHLGATYAKDFDWVDGKPVNVPLGQGRAKPLFDLIQQDGLVGPISLHMEYTDHRDPNELEKSWQAICNDVATLKTWLK